MGKIVATYAVKVTIRERDGLTEAERADESKPPTIAEIEELVVNQLDGWDDYLTASATAERTDI